MEQVKIIVCALGDANARLWRRSKALWLVGLGLGLCICCAGFGWVSTLMPGYAERATATAQARSAQATALASETENARVIAEWTATANTGLSSSAKVIPTVTLLANVRLDTATPRPITSTLSAPRATTTIFYVVITNTTTRTRAPAETLPSATRPPTGIVPTQANGGGGGNFDGPVGVCTTGCSVSTPPAGCLIKGNVNSKGEKVYHTPGQRDYEKTQIKPEEGDAWFCTWQEAEQAGFRHAQR